MDNIKKSNQKCSKMVSECALRIRCEFAASEKKSASNSIRIHGTPYTKSNIQWKCRNQHWTAFHCSTVLVGLNLLIVEVSRSHSNTPHSVVLLRTSDQLVADTPTWQQTTFKRDTHPWPGRIRTRNPCKRKAADLRLRPWGLWDRPTSLQTETRNAELRYLLE
jgi:hypothetical protein